MTISTIDEITRAVSLMARHDPLCIGGRQEHALPPSWVIPASNDTRVRVDDFAKIIAITFPFENRARYRLAEVALARTHVLKAQQLVAV